MNVLRSAGGSGLPRTLGKNGEKTGRHGRREIWGNFLTKTNLDCLINAGTIVKPHPRVQHWSKNWASHAAYVRRGQLELALFMICRCCDGLPLLQQTDCLLALSRDDPVRITS
jgi:hypothetical protein